VSEGYAVVLQHLVEAAEAFRKAALTTSGVHREFTGAAAITDSAFGNLADSWKLANQVQAFLHQVDADMKTLLDSLDGASARLDQTALNYLLAEIANTLPGTG
jgi:hypothetical protein